MAYTPVELTKDGKTTWAQNLEEETQLRWDGWLPTGAPAPDHSWDVVRVKDLGDSASPARVELQAAFVAAKVLTASGDMTGATDTAAINAALAAHPYVVLGNPTGADVFYFDGTITVPTGVCLEMRPGQIVYDQGAQQPHRLQRVGAWTGDSLVVHGALRNVVVVGALKTSGETGVRLYGADVDGLFVFDHGDYQIVNEAGAGLRNRTWACNGKGAGIYLAASDSQWSDYYVAGNASHGIATTSGIGNTNFGVGKIEWNLGNNINCFESSLAFVGCDLDRSGLEAVETTGGTVRLVGGTCRRSFSSAPGAAGSAHFRCDGGGEVVAVNVAFSHGHDDDGVSGTDSPDYLVSGFDSSSSSHVTLVGCDATAGYLTGLSNAAYVSGTIAVAEVATRTAENGKVHTSNLNFVTSGTAAAAGAWTTAAVPTGLSLGTFVTPVPLKLIVAARDPNTGAPNAAEIGVLLTREAGNASVLLEVTNTFGGLFGTTGATVNVTAVTAVDGSTVTLTFTNTGATDPQALRVELLAA